MKKLCAQMDLAIVRDDPEFPASAVAYDCDGDFLYRFDEDWTDNQIRAALGIRDLPEPV